MANKIDKLQRRAEYCAANGEENSLMNRRANKMAKRVKKLEKKDRRNRYQEED